MKKIFTFLFCTSIITSAFAQDYSHDEKNINTTIGYSSNSKVHRNFDYQNTINQRDEEIQKVNYQNEWQVQQVVNNCDLSVWEKRDILNNLETQRIQKLNDIYYRYSNVISYYRGNVKSKSLERSYLDVDHGR